MPTALLPRTLAVLLAPTLMAAGLARAQEESHVLDLATYPRTSLEITHRAAGQSAHRIPFTVWVADTPPRAEQGLMFVRDLPESMGMIFPLDPPRIEHMWMKNTYIELDMLFIDANGRVGKILERAHPLSEQILSSDVPVAAVLELKGGAASRLGLSVGDSVSWKKPAPP
jgi:uncharacterized protein